MTYDMAGDGADSKRLLGRLGAGALAFSAMASLGAKAASAATTTYTDVDILNFALNLEYLEAEYYLRAVTGAGLPSSLTGNMISTVDAPATTLVPFQTPAIAGWAQKIAVDEYAHVNFLKVALGGSAVVEPAIDFVSSFTTLASKAGLIPSGATFDPFASEIDFLIGAYIFEDVGVTAYAGAAGALTEPANIAYSASILAIEGMHAGLIRSFLAEIGGSVVTNKISALRQTLSGVTDKGTDQSAMGGLALTFGNSDYNGQVYRRTPQQVLNIVYGAPGAGVASGLFFPSGMTGTITQS